MEVAGSPTRLRAVLLGAAIFDLVAGGVLFVLADDTGRYFAWTVDSPRSAVFLGACFWGTSCMAVIAFAEHDWVRARGVAIASFVFAGLGLVATLLTAGHLHLAGTALPGRVAAWAWLVAGLVSPPVLLWLLWINEPADLASARDSPLGWLMRAPVALQSLLLLAVGAGLFTFPARMPWPWAWTPASGRLAGAFLVAYGVAGLAVLLDPRRTHARAVMAGYAAVAVFELIALLRFLGSINWRPAGWVYLAFLASLLVTGGAGFYLGFREDRRRRAAPFVR